MPVVFFHGVPIGRPAVPPGEPVQNSLIELWSGNVSALEAIELDLPIHVGDIVVLQHNDVEETISNPILILDTSLNRDYWFSFGASGVTGIAFNATNTSINITHFTAGFGLKKIYRLNQKLAG